MFEAARERWAAADRRSAEAQSRPPDVRPELNPVEDQIEDLYQSRGIGIAILCYAGFIALIVLGIRWVITQF